MSLPLRLSSVVRSRRARLLTLALFLSCAGGVGLHSLCGFWSRPEKWVVPVEGVLPRHLVSTFGAPREGGRRKHRGADIFARRGTPVRSATAGIVLKVGEDRLGGRVVTVLGEGRALYYYAHLDDWAPSLRPWQRVSAGTILGNVGNTGNARTTPPHLHFGVYRFGWSGLRAVDPVPLLR